jgi:hypothetical protein
MEGIVKTLVSPNNDERVVIRERRDDYYTFQREFFNIASGNWSDPGPDCGIYDSALGAETEARQRVDWLRSAFH